MVSGRFVIGAAGRVIQDVQIKCHLYRAFLRAEGYPAIAELIERYALPGTRAAFGRLPARSFTNGNPPVY